MKRNKTVLAIVLFAFILSCAVAVGAAFSGINDTGTDIGALPVNTIKGQFVYDTDNERQAVGIADYVFAGRVVGIDGTHYKDSVIMENKDGSSKEVGTPYTDITVKVIKNIKGKLRTDKDIKLIKHGGVSKDKKAVMVFEKDRIPEKEQTYIFLAYAQKDGTLLVSGPNSNIPTKLDKKLNSDGNNVINTDEYIRYKSAFENEIIPVERQRFTSSFEK